MTRQVGRGAGCQAWQPKLRENQLLQVVLWPLHAVFHTQSKCRARQMAYQVKWLPPSPTTWPKLDPPLPPSHTVEKKKWFPKVVQMGHVPASTCTQINAIKNFLMQIKYSPVSMLFPFCFHYFCCTGNWTKILDMLSILSQVKKKSILMYFFFLLWSWESNPVPHKEILNYSSNLGWTYFLLSLLYNPGCPSTYDLSVLIPKLDYRFRQPCLAMDTYSYRIIVKVFNSLGSSNW